MTINALSGKGEFACNNSKVILLRYVKWMPTNGPHTTMPAITASPGAVHISNKLSNPEKPKVFPNQTRMSN